MPSALWLAFKAHRLLYRSTLGLRVIKKKKKVPSEGGQIPSAGGQADPYGNSSASSLSSLE
jgi:hypothetical protein